MAFTNSNDINILQASDAGVVGAGAGDDRYVLSASTLAANQQITISDAAGVNSLQLVGGLVVVSSRVSNDALQLTLNNGAVITILGASTFNYITGGDSLTGTGGTTQNFSTFVPQSLGATVPAAGAAPVSGGTVTVNANGGTTAGPGTGTPTPNPGTPGQTFTLTQGADNIQANDQNNTITALFDNGVPSFQASDIVNGAGGDDTLNFVTNTATQSLSNVSNVEFFNATASATALTLDLNQVSTEKGVGTINSTVNTTFNNISGPAVTLGVTGGVGGGAPTTASFNFIVGSLAGTNDVATLNLNSAQGNINVSNQTAGLEAITVNAQSGSSNVADLALDGTGGLSTKTLNITGSGNVVLGSTTAVIESITRIDATAATGNVTISQKGPGNINATFGSGNSTFILGGLSTTDTVVGGSGTNDVFVSANDAAAQNAANGIASAALGNRVTGFEVQGFINGNVTQDADNFNVTRYTTIVDNIGGEVVINNAKTSNTFNVAHDLGILRTNLKVNGATDSLTVNIGSNTQAVQINQFRPDAGTESVVVNTQGTFNTNRIVSIDTAITNLTVTGSSDLRIDNTNALTSNLNAAAFTGKLTAVATAGVGVLVLQGGTNDDTLTGGENDIVDGGAGNDSLTANGATVQLRGGLGNDTFATGGNAVTVEGGDGIDTITAGAGVQTIRTNAITAANADVINAFATTADKFIFTGTGASGVNNDGVTAIAMTSVASGATLADALAANVSGTVFVVQNDLTGAAKTALTNLAGATSANLASLYATFENALAPVLAGVSNLDARLGASEAVLIAFDDGTDSVVVRATNTDATGNSLTSAELDLVGVFKTAVVAGGDFFV